MSDTGAPAANETSTSAAGNRPIRPVSGAIAAPVFILAPPRSFTSVICAMLGQHPQMYSVPELQLFGAETMAEWWSTYSLATPHMTHGLLRAVAELHFGSQTDYTIMLAHGWLQRRSHFTTGLIFEALAERAHPRILVDKSPGIVYQRVFLERAHKMFPRARFIHLLRHPRGQGESVMKAVTEAAKVHPVVPRWMLRLASYPDSSASEADPQQHPQDWDPQRAWYALNKNICDFLESLPSDQKLQIRGEDLLTDPDQGLRYIADWMGLRTDAEAIEEMKHPERSPYACFGPRNAPFGNDHFFLRSPAIRPSRARSQSLEGALSWRQDGRGFLPRVKQLARQFGYD